MGYKFSSFFRNVLSGDIFFRSNVQPAVDKNQSRAQQFNDDYEQQNIAKNQYSNTDTRHASSADAVNILVNISRRYSWPLEQDSKVVDELNTRPSSVGPTVNDRAPPTTPSASHIDSQQEHKDNGTPVVTPTVVETYHDLRSRERNNRNEKLAKKKKNYLYKLKKIENSSLSGKELLHKLEKANWTRPADCKKEYLTLKATIKLVMQFESTMNSIANDPIAVTVQGFEAYSEHLSKAKNAMFEEKLSRCHNLRPHIEGSEVLSQKMKDHLLTQLDFHTNILELAKNFHYRDEKNNGAVKYSIPKHGELAYHFFRKDSKAKKNPYDRIIFKDLAPKEVREIVKAISIGKGFDVWHMQKNWLGKNKPQTVNQKLALAQKANGESTHNAQSIPDGEVNVEYVPCNDENSVARSNSSDLLDETESKSIEHSISTSEEFQNETLQSTLERIHPLIQTVPEEGQITIDGHDSLERHLSHRAIRSNASSDQKSDISSILPTVSMLGEPSIEAHNSTDLNQSSDVLIAHPDAASSVHDGHSSILSTVSLLGVGSAHSESDLNDIDTSSQRSHDVIREGTLERTPKVETLERNINIEPTPVKVETVKRSFLSYQRNSGSRSAAQESTKAYQPVNPLPVPVNLNDLFKLCYRRESTAKNNKSESAQIAAAQNALSTLLVTQLSLPDNVFLTALAEKLASEASEHQRNEIAAQSIFELRKIFVTDQLKNYIDLDGVYKNLKPKLIAKYENEFDNKFKIDNSGEIDAHILAATQSHFIEKAKTTLSIFPNLQNVLTNNKNAFLNSITPDSRMLSVGRRDNKTKKNDYDFYMNKINQHFDVEMQAVNTNLIDHLAELVQPEMSVNEDRSVRATSIDNIVGDWGELLQMI